jgi:pyruvate carboxylase
MAAMKMETSVGAPCAVQHVAVVRGDSVDTADLLVLIRQDDGAVVVSMPRR